jgi:HK97 family phage major capsid protein
MEFETILTEIKTDLAGFVAKANEEIKSLGGANKETIEKIDKLQKQLNEVDMKLARPAGGDAPKSLLDELKNNEAVQRLAKDRSGRAILTFKGLGDIERKTTVTSAAVGSATSGVLMFERMPGIVPQAMKKMFIRDLLPSAPVGANAIDYVKVNAFTSAASPQAEAANKDEAALTFTTATANVRTLAHWIPATKQVLDDMPGLAAMIQSELIYGLKDKEEQEILSGDNTGVHLNGLITQATAFNTGLLIPVSDGWEKADVIRRAMQQVESANETSPDWVALNPVDWASIELNKETDGHYIFGGPASVLAPRLWGLQVLKSNNITSGTFLLGNSTGAMIRDREEVTIELSTEHSDYFIKNMVAIRCEERLALVVTRPASFIYGASLTQSPA